MLKAVKDLLSDWYVSVLRHGNRDPALEIAREQQKLFNNCNIAQLLDFFQVRESMSGRIDYDGSANSIFPKEATPSGSGHAPFYEFSWLVANSESPLEPPAVQPSSYSSSSYAIPATVIVVSVAALLLLAGGLKLCGHIRLQRKRQSYEYKRATSKPGDGNPTLLGIKTFNAAGYKTCPHGNGNEWSVLPLEELHRETAVHLRQPSLREAIRITDALDAELHQEEENNVEAELDREGDTTSLDSSTCRDFGTSSQTTVVVEVEVHS